VPEGTMAQRLVAARRRSRRPGSPAASRRGTRPPTGSPRCSRSSTRLQRGILALRGRRALRRARAPDRLACRRAGETRCATAIGRSTSTSTSCGSSSSRRCRTRAPPHATSVRLPVLPGAFTHFSHGGHAPVTGFGPVRASLPPRSQGIDTRGAPS
jgi:hypothetical protein